MGDFASLTLAVQDGHASIQAPPAEWSPEATRRRSFGCFSSTLPQGRQQPRAVWALPLDSRVLPQRVPADHLSCHSALGGQDVRTWPSALSREADGYPGAVTAVLTDPGTVFTGVPLLPVADDGGAVGPELEPDTEWPLSRFLIRAGRVKVGHDSAPIM
jgi:hypothetical protein